MAEYVAFENFREVSYIKPLQVLWFLEGYTHCKASTETWASECVLDFSLEKSFMCFFTAAFLCTETDLKALASTLHISQ